MGGGERGRGGRTRRNLLLCDGRRRYSYAHGGGMMCLSFGLWNNRNRIEFFKRTDRVFMQMDRILDFRQTDRCELQKHTLDSTPTTYGTSYLLLAKTPTPSTTFILLITTVHPLIYSNRTKK